MGKRNLSQGSCTRWVSQRDFEARKDEDSGADEVIKAAQMELDHSVAPGKDLEFWVRPFLPVCLKGMEGTCSRQVSALS
jgi:hypothetical protein